MSYPAYFRQAGGCCRNPTAYVRVAYLYEGGPSYCSGRLGFRVVRRCS